MMNTAIIMKVATLTTGSDREARGMFRPMDRAMVSLIMGIIIILTSTHKIK